MNIDTTSTCYERGFDEETGATIHATACPSCGGKVCVDGGQIECSACGVVLDEYARTGRFANRAVDDPEVPAEVA